VVIGITSTSAISAPVILVERRSSAISWTLRSGVAVGELCGRLERSSRPDSPSAR
jgi:hypothetical protein